MKKLVFIVSVLIAAFCFCGCSGDENDDLLNDRLNEKSSDTVSIIGIWELKTLCYPGNDEVEIPVEKRDIFVFSSNGKVNVTKKRKSDFQDFPNEDGEYDYSYDKEKQIITLCGKTRECIITDSIMNLESCYFSDCGEPIQNFIFIKKQI